MNEDRCLDLMTGISIYLLTICLSILLIIGGIEINLGPISGDENSDNSLNLDVGVFEFASKEQVSKPFIAVRDTSIPASSRKIPVGFKKRRKVLLVHVIIQNLPLHGPFSYF